MNVGRMMKVIKTGGILSAVMLLLLAGHVTADDGIGKAKMYDRSAKTTYSENDVRAFVYQWFAGFDHQADIGFFKRHLNSEKVDMYFPDCPVRSIADFEKWYQNVVDNIQWNAHVLSNLRVSGNEAGGFDVSLDVNWKARTYQNQTYDMHVHQDWLVTVNNDRTFIIARHRAKVIDKP